VQPQRRSYAPAMYFLGFLVLVLLIVVAALVLLVVKLAKR
jgi:hypothetical protein